MDDFGSDKVCEASLGGAGNGLARARAALHTGAAQHGSAAGSGAFGTGSANQPRACVLARCGTHGFDGLRTRRAMLPFLTWLTFARTFS
eukprot:6180552-Pleurochrysis_carterae.AAC.1